MTEMTAVTAEINPLANPLLLEDSDVRTAVDKEGNPWFCAKDVFFALAIKWGGRSTSLANVPEEWVLTLQYRTSYGVKPTLFLHSGAMALMVTRSRKPGAETFIKWLFGDVLTALRKQGFYGTVPPDKLLAYIKQINATTQQLVKATDAYEQQLLLITLRALHNAAGLEMPALDLLGKRADQLTLDLKNGAEA